MKQLKALAVSTVAISMSLAMPFSALAQNPFQNAQQLTNRIGQQATGSAPADLPTMIGKIINIVLGFLGIILLVIMLWAGFMWMTAGGNDDKVKEARQYISNSVIGLVIIVAAFAISNFVLGSLVNVSSP